MLSASDKTVAIEYPQSRLMSSGGSGLQRRRSWQRIARFCPPHLE